MNKDNVFRSSKFHMDAGDVLKILIIDETGSPVTIDLVGDVSLDTVPNAPIATDASDINNTSFIAHWYFTENTTGYYLDVSEDLGFSSYVAGFSNKDVSNVNEYLVNGLTQNTTYYFRVRGYNDIGSSANSNIITTITTAVVVEPLLDKDGNVYTTVFINNREWIVENLRTTKYANGDAIANITDDATWAADATGAYCWFDDNIANKEPYGALYNWYAVTHASELAYLERDGIQETGWRVPTEEDILAISLYVGAQLKEYGYDHWLAPNTEATNETGFTAVGAGYRNDDGSYEGFKEETHIISSENYGGANAVYLIMWYNSGAAGSNLNPLNNGYSVRLVRDITETTPQYVSYVDGAVSVRKGVRDGNFVIDITLTPLGFAGVENTDWQNLKIVTHEDIPLTVTGDFQPSTHNLYFSPAGQSRDVTVNCDEAWTLVSSHGDITTDILGASGSSLVTITVAAGVPSNPLGIITFSSPSYDDVVVTIIRQN